MHPSFIFGQYLIVNIYHRKAPQIRNKIKQLWHDLDMFDDEEFMRKRLPDVALVAMDANKQVVGLSTVSITSKLTAPDAYYFYRTVIHPQHHTIGMAQFMIIQTYDLLNDLELDNKPKGVIIVSANKKLMRPGAVKKFQQHGCTLMGTNDHGSHIWRKDFLQEKHPIE